MANKGNYYKIKTAEYFRKLGYTVEYMEKLQHLFVKGKVLYVKRDLLGADIIAVNETETILANSITNRGDLAKHIKKFMEYPAGGMKRWILIWQPRQEPEIVEVE